MSCSINLIPVARLHFRARARRRTAWFGVWTVLGVGAVCGWTLQHAATGAVARLAGQVDALEVQRTELQRRMSAAALQRTQLIKQLETIAAARRPQPWARRLVTLTQVAPEGVFLTSLNVATPGGDPSPGAAAVSQGSGARAQSPAALLRQEPRLSRAQVVHVLGYAVDHAALIQFVNALQKLPDWQQVELVRATLEPYRAGSAVSFELDCRTQEERP